MSVKMHVHDLFTTITSYLGHAHLAIIERPNRIHISCMVFLGVLVVYVLSSNCAISASGFAIIDQAKAGLV